MTKPAEHGDTFELGLKRSSLEGRVIFACINCRAPGVYSNHESIMQGWPACYDPIRVGQPVGDKCPECGTDRGSDNDLGELNASIPLWLWKTILGVKSLVVTVRRATSRLKQRRLGNAG